MWAWMSGCLDARARKADAKANAGGVAAAAAVEQQCCSRLEHAVADRSALMHDLAIARAADRG